MRGQEPFGQRHLGALEHGADGHRELHRHCTRCSSRGPDGAMLLALESVCNSQ